MFSPKYPRRMVFAALAVVASLLMTSVAAYAAANQSETYQALLAQINKGQARSATISPTHGIVRVRLSDGRHVQATYPSNGESQLASVLRSHGAVTHIKKARHHAAVKTTSHIRYRYIALAIIVLAALAALGYYLLRGRPTVPADPGMGAGEGAAAGTAPPPAGAAAQPPAGTAPPPAGHEPRGPGSAGRGSPSEPPPPGREAG